MYMPGFKDFFPKIQSNAMPGLTSMVLCCEDACPEEKVPEAEENIHSLLDRVTESVENGTGMWYTVSGAARHRGMSA